MLKTGMRLRSLMFPDLFVILIRPKNGGWIGAYRTTSRAMDKHRDVHWFSADDLTSHYVPEPMRCKFCGRTMHVHDYRCSVCEAKQHRGASLKIKYPTP